LRESLFGSRFVVIAASTREGEEEKVLEAFALLQQSIPHVALVLVPRHPERVQGVLAQTENRNLKVVSRTDLIEAGMAEHTDVLLGDTMGEMFFYYSLADVAFVGGSLVNTGCQNILEPAALGLPIITGPSLFNFTKVSDDLIAAGAQQVVNDVQELADALRDILANDEKRSAMGASALEEFGKKSGASKDLLARLQKLSG
jgi:3-deoxy-D-manno-octulosonic-acid transferase